MDQNEEQLKNIFGLDAYEARLYVAAIRTDKGTVTDLAKKAGIPRTAAYEPIKSLLKQGLLAAVKVGKRTHYRGTPPARLKHILERRQVQLKEVVERLEQQISVPERELAIRYFEGMDGITMAADIILEEGRTKHACSWETTAVNLREHRHYGKAALRDYIKRRVAKGVSGNVIYSADPNDPYLKEFLARDREELRRSLFVDPKKYPFKAAMMAYDDMVMIFTFGAEEFAVLIKNKDIAETITTLHKMYWDRYEA
jgi:HTH-type transcriptional regulator, sugar sensing transcriptional regulator